MTPPASLATENSVKHESVGVLAAKLEAVVKHVLAMEEHETPPKKRLRVEEPEDLHIAKDAAQLIGNTPLVYLNKIARDSKARIAVKLEYFSPGGSVKDRIALSMIEDAEDRGLITPGKSILTEATSGNTGIGLAVIAAIKGYKLILVMPDKCSIERRMLLLQLGAKVVLTDATKGVQGVLDKLDEVLEKTPHAFPVGQFDNVANPATHVRTTAPEIWRDTAGKVDVFVANSGTGGTISGVSQYLKAKNPHVHTVVVEPFESAVLSGGEPGPHKIQGTGPGMIPPNLERTHIDEILKVKGDDALATAREVALTDGLLVGISAGAAIKGALDLGSREENQGKLIVALLPSGAERYLSTELYETSRKQAEALAVEEVYVP